MFGGGNVRPHEATLWAVILSSPMALFCLVAASFFLSLSLSLSLGLSLRVSVVCHRLVQLFAVETDGSAHTHPRFSEAEVSVADDGRRSSRSSN